MKIENVNDIIAFVKEAIKRQYYIYERREKEKAIFIKISNNCNPTIELEIVIGKEYIYVHSYDVNYRSSGEYEIKYKLNNREEAHLSLLLSDIKEYRAKQAMKDVATFFDNYDENKKLAQNINNLDDDEE